jgi:predicted glycogen debranching enzyme
VSDIETENLPLTSLETTSFFAYNEKNHTLPFVEPFFIGYSLSRNQPKERIVKLIQFDAQLCQDLDQVTQREWFESNGVGGYASSTLACVNTRRYHGLLVSPLTPSDERFILLNNLDETLYIGDEAYPLGTQFYAGTIYPKGYQNLWEFQLHPFPVWIFRVDDLVLAKCVLLIHGEPTVFVRYQILAGDENWVRLEVRPIVSFRKPDTFNHASDKLCVNLKLAPGQIQCIPSEATPKLNFYHNAAILDQSEIWYRGVQYPDERYEGRDFEEDLFSPFRLEYSFMRGGEVFLCATLSTKTTQELAETVAREDMRRRELAKSISVKDPFFQAMSYAAHSFFIGLPGSANEAGKGESESSPPAVTSLPSFETKTRDILTAFHGLFLATAQYAKGRELLVHYAHQAKHGLLPGHFIRSHNDEESAAADSPLWFIHDCFEYFKYTEDRKTVEHILFPATRHVIEWYVKGTNFGIGLTAEGLIACGAGATTSMDKASDCEVCSSHSRLTVHVQALWHNALSEMALMAEAFGSEALKKNYLGLAARAKRSFNRMFWVDELKRDFAPKGYLCDSIRNKKKNLELRSGQILALGLPFPILEENSAKWNAILDVARRYLLTPYGLRTLAPFEPHYHGRYEGNLSKRSKIYNEGMAVPWLLVPFARAVLHNKHNSKNLKNDISALLKPFTDQLFDHGLGFVSEIFDGDKPFQARGAIASVLGSATCLELCEILYGQMAADMHSAKTVSKVSHP